MQLLATVLSCLAKHSPASNVSEASAERMSGTVDTVSTRSNDLIRWVISNDLIRWVHIISKNMIRCVISNDMVRWLRYHFISLYQVRGEVEQQPYLAYRGQSGQVREGCEPRQQSILIWWGGGWNSKTFLYFFFHYGNWRNQKLYLKNAMLPLADCIESSTSSTQG